MNIVIAPNREDFGRKLAENLGYYFLDCDVTNPLVLRECSKDISPTYIIYYSDETSALINKNNSFNDAFMVHVIGVKNVLDVFDNSSSVFIYLSTDKVFSGRIPWWNFIKRRKGYSVKDDTKPETVYGVLKLAGEAISLSTFMKSYILRLPEIFTPERILQEASSVIPHHYPDFVYRSFVSFNTVVGCIKYLVENTIRINTPIIHIGGLRAFSYAEFFDYVFKFFDLNLRVEPQKHGSSDILLPFYGKLDVSDAIDLGFPLVTLNTELLEIKEELLCLRS